MNMGRIRSSARRCATLALLLSACSSEPAGDVESAALGNSALMADESIHYLQRLQIGSLGSTPVRLANGRLLRADLAADSALVRHRQLARELASVAPALAAPAVTTEELIETEHTVKLVATTRMVVVDPAALRSGSAIASKFRMRGPGASSLTSLTSEQRSFFDGFKAKMLLKPPSHPLGAAARQGNQALWNAMLAGKGDYTITTTVEVPSDSLTVQDDGSYLAPSFSQGAFDYGNLQAGSLQGFAAHSQLASTLNPGTLTESGEFVTVTPFVNGFTEADAFEWEERWDFGFGYVEVEAGASYGAGLRIPVQVTSSMSPTEISQRNGVDQESEFFSSISVDVFDANEAFYEDAGLADIDIQDGKELVLNASAHVTVTFDILGAGDDLTKGVGVDFGEHFTPPFGDCGTDCGLDFWVPAELTKTVVDLGLAGGEAEVGFNVSGDGEVVLDYQSLYDHEPVISARGAGDGLITHELSFTSAGEERKLHTTLAPLSEPGSKVFGYEISDVDYTWNLEITPGIRGQVWVDCWLLEWDEEIGPLWLNFASVDLGSLTFGTHAGSRTARVVNQGTKSWIETKAAVNPNHGALASQQAGTATTVSSP